MCVIEETREGGVCVCVCVYRQLEVACGPIVKSCACVCERERGRVCVCLCVQAL